MVTSYLDSRKTIGNRGSKSIRGFIPLIVKEQRVDGSWYGKIFTIFKVYSYRMPKGIYRSKSLLNKLEIKDSFQP